mgnify:CR=1 FL=1
MQLNKKLNQIDKNVFEENLEPRDLKGSNQDKLLKYYEKYMILIGIGGQSLFYLQAFKIFMTGSARDVSLSGFIIASISLVSWLIYGIIIKNTVLVTVNAIAVVGAALTLFAIFWVS